MSTKRNVIIMIEHVVFIFLVAFLAVICIEKPKLHRGHPNSNEPSAAGTLKTIVIAHTRMNANAWIDADGGGIGEYGVQEQLAEVDKSDNGGDKPMAVNPPFITAVLGMAPEGEDYSLKSGYYFKMFLDDSNMNTTEQVFVCYAWPKVWGVTGKMAFMVTQDGTVYYTEGEVVGYSGDNAPELESAFVAYEMQPDPFHNRPPSFSYNERGADGNVWKEYWD